MLGISIAAIGEDKVFVDHIVAVVIFAITDFVDWLAGYRADRDALPRQIVAFVPRVARVELAVRDTDRHAFGTKLVTAAVPVGIAELPTHLAAPNGVIETFTFGRTDAVVVAFTRAIPTGIVGITPPVDTVCVHDTDSSEGLRFESDIRECGLNVL